MVRRKQASVQPTDHDNGLQHDATLDHRLVLLAWLYPLFGYRSNREMLEDCNSVGEGFDTDGHRWLYHHLIPRGGTSVSWFGEGSRSRGEPCSSVDIKGC